MTKSELRKIYFDKRKSLSAVERTGRSSRIAGNLFERLDLENIRFLHVFLPIEKRGEIETAFVFKRLWKDFPEVAVVVPRIDFKTMTLENRRFTPETKLVKNRWHIAEPPDGEAIETEKIDAVLVPLLCFDASGFRVGYGKGFYDKFLSECRKDCLKIGLSYFAPVEEIADAQAFDVRMDFCVTPEEVFTRKT